MKPSSIAGHKPSDPPMLRRELGEVLCDLRQSRSMALRDVSVRARVLLGYLSEIERGQKEASSKLLVAIRYALDVPVGLVLREVVNRTALQERVFVGEALRTFSVGLLRSLILAI